MTVRFFQADPLPIRVREPHKKIRYRIKNAFPHQGAKKSIRGVEKNALGAFLSPLCNQTGKYTERHTDTARTGRSDATDA